MTLNQIIEFTHYSRTFWIGRIESGELKTLDLSKDASRSSYRVFKKDIAAYLEKHYF